MASFKSKVLNLWDNGETKRFRILPEEGQVRFQYENGSLPVEVSYLTANGENVYSKMMANAQAVLDEKARAEGVESVLSNSITAETNARSSAVSNLQSELDAEKARVATQEQFEASERAAEQSARISADNALTATLNAEIQSRQAQDAQHTNDINAENLRAENREDEIELKLDAYVLSNDTKIGLIDEAHNEYVDATDARLDAIEAKATSDSSGSASALQAEVDTRVSEVARVDARIDFIVSNVDSAALDSLAEIVTKFNNDGATYESRLSNIESVLQQLVEQLGS